MTLKEWAGKIDGVLYHIREPPFYKTLGIADECTKVSDWGSGEKNVDIQLLQIKQVQIYLVEPAMTEEEVRNMSPSVASFILMKIRSFDPSVDEEKK